MADPISIVSGCVKLAKEIYDLKKKIDQDNAACSEFFYRIQALQVPLEELGRQNTQVLNVKRASLLQINETLSNILDILNVRMNNKKSNFGVFRNATSSYSGKFSSCLSDLNIQLDRCVSAVHFCTSVDMNAVILDMRAMLLQSQAVQQSAASVFVKDPKPTLEDLDRLSILGRGAFGVTHRVINTVDMGVYAMKEINVADALSVGLQKEDLRKEAVILQKLNHTHIVRYFTSYFSRNESVFNVVMELISGGSLADKISDQSVTVDLIGKWMAQMASALQYLHYDMRIQHRDIKPENVLLCDNGGKIKLIDLGTASAMRTVATKMSRVGTSVYFSYEKANDIPYDGRDDVWAAGCVFAELLTKSRLTQRGGAIHLYTNKAVNDRRLTLLSDCKRIDERLGSIVSHMLEPEQEKRCTAEELSRCLGKSDAVKSIAVRDLSSEQEPDISSNTVLTEDAPLSTEGLVKASRWLQRALPFSFGSFVRGVCCNADRTRLAVCGDCDYIKIYNLIDMNEEPLTLHIEPYVVVYVYNICFSPDGSKLAATSTFMKELYVFDAKNGDVIWKQYGNIHGIIFTCDSSALVAVGYTIDVHDATSGVELSTQQVPAHNGFSTAGSTLVVAGRDSVEKIEKVTVLDNWTEIRVSFRVKDTVKSLCVTANGSKVLVGPLFELVEIFDAYSGQCIDVIDIHGSWFRRICLRDLELNSENTVLISTSDDGLKVWNASNYTLIQCLQLKVNCLEFMSCSSIIYGSGHTIEILEAQEANVNAENQCCLS